MKNTTAAPAAQASVRSSRSSWWGDRGVKVKVLAGVGVAGLAAGTIGVLGLTSLDAAAARTNDLYQSNVQSMVAATDMRSALKDTRVATRDAILAPTPEITRKSLDKAAALQAAFHAAADRYATIPGAQPDDIANVRKAVTEYDVYVAAAEAKLKPLALVNDYAGWYRVNNDEVAPLATQAENDAAALVVNETKQAGITTQDAHDAATRQRYVQIGVLAGGLVLALLVGYLVARALARGVTRVQKVAEALSAGDLTASSGLTTNDELGRMGQALDSAVEELRRVMTTVVSSADAVSASSEELSRARRRSRPRRRRPRRSPVWSPVRRRRSPGTCRRWLRARSRWVRRSGRSRRTRQRRRRWPRGR